MGDYRIMIEGIGSHHGCSDSCADTVARAAVAELQRMGHNVKSAKLAALVGAAGGFDADERNDPPASPIDLMRPVPSKGLVVDYHYTNAGGTRCKRPAVIAVAWSETCINVNVDFQGGDTQRGYGEFPAMGTSRTSVLGALDGGPGGVDDPPSWSARS